ncbi:Protein of uncharacterised function (DUF3279) [Serratia quinivorans]|nr:Protein of uncharacterised function (DUF3279) [Serratia quinivorans]
MFHNVNGRLKGAITTQAAPNDSYICLLCGCMLQDCPYAKPDTSEIQLIHHLQHLIPNG